MKTKKVYVIGAGLGGLAVGCLLAADGHRVTVFEKNENPGGKINQIKAGGFRFDTGPSLLTLPFILEKLFSRCGADIKDYLTLRPVNPICRYFYKDGTIFSCHQQLDKTLDEIKRFAPDDADNYQNFLEYSSDLYDHTKDAFLFNPLYNVKDVGNLNVLDFFKVDAFKTVSERVDDYFESPHLRQFFKRFTTYNGSSPYQAPATLNVIPHVELSLGGYYVEGGMYQIVAALHQLAQELGVQFSFDTEIDQILHENGQAHSILTAEGKKHSANLIISNGDASETYLNLLADEALSSKKKKTIRSLEPSCSGFVVLLGIAKKYNHLTHHNIFFSSDYKKEFEQIFQDKIMPDDPTIYIANTSETNPEHAPEGGSNLFILVNAPYLSEKWDWKKQEPEYARFIINELEKRGLEHLSSSIEFQHHISPVDFYRQYGSNKGSIYGTSSNSKLAAFLRPRNKAKKIENLYLVGGSTHPGGGIPLVILSAFNAIELIQRYG